MGKTNDWLFEQWWNEYTRRMSPGPPEGLKEMAKSLWVDCSGATLARVVAMLHGMARKAEDDGSPVAGLALRHGATRVAEIEI